MKNKPVPKELIELRSRLNKMAKEQGYGFYTKVADGIGVSYTLISLFKEGKKALSISSFFALKVFLDDVEMKNAKKSDN